MATQRRDRFLEVRDEGGRTVARFTDAILDEVNLQAIARELAVVVGGLGSRPLCLDLGNVRFLSSAWLGEFITILKQLRASGGRMMLVNTDPQIYDVFATTHLTELFDIRRTGEDEP